MIAEKHTTISLDLQEYLAKIVPQSIDKKLDGYFSADVVIDAFTKGEEIGKEKALQNFREEFIRKSTQVFLYGINLSKGLMDKGFNISSFYINPFHFIVVIATDVKNTYDEDFIENFYKLSYDYQDRFRKDFNDNMELHFMRNDGVDENALEIDGFIKVGNNE